MMAEHPIPFSTEMVRAILDGRKTQTRRIAKLPEEWHRGFSAFENNPNGAEEFVIHGDCGTETTYCPYGKVGDTLWVREATKHYGNKFSEAKGYALVEYKDGENREIDLTYILENEKELPRQKWWGKGESKWTSARFMFKWAARIFLEITNIRVERVQDIGESDIISEGCPEFTSLTGIDELYAARMWWWNELWNSINAKRGYGWDKNPWVWVIEFKRMTFNSEPS